MNSAISAGFHDLHYTRTWNKIYFIDTTENGFFKHTKNHNNLTDISLYITALSPLFNLCIAHLRAQENALVDLLTSLYYKNISCQISSTVS
uniref:Uncharacterized protein n=1 Tax=Anguilla anguilla TaxID=7936 RepID=A0A0E9XD91_ANGAN